MRGYATEGFGMLKMKLGLLPVREDALRVERVREVLGDDFVLFADANHAYNSATAIQMGRVLEAADFSFFEEPVPPEDREGYARVRARVDVPIAGGEAEYTRYGFRDFIAAGCVNICSPMSASAAGSPRSGRSPGARLRAQPPPHPARLGIRGGAGGCVTGLRGAAPGALHSPRRACPERAGDQFDRSRNPLRDELLTSGFVLREGYLDVPAGPGLGVEVDMEVVARYAVASASLGRK